MTPTKILSLFLCFCLILEQGVFAQTIDLSHYFVRNPAQTIPQSDKFRPLHLRYISYDNQANDFKILLDKGDFFNQQTPKLPNSSTPKLEEATQELMKYFFIGLALPNEKFWVNLRPDSPDNILDPDLEKTDIGRIFLEADLQLKKDTSGMTSPRTKEGREYWDKLYKKAGELFGSENITIPTITRPWIVPNEIIIREAPDNAYIYKATLKVMLEEDYLNQKTEKPKNGKTEELKNQRTDWHSFSDPRLKELNQYSTRLIKETIIPKLTYAVNTAKRYAPLRQVYYSLILAQWFKQKYGSPGSIRASGARAPVNSYIDQIDSGNLTKLTSIQPYDKQVYFQQYQKSFQDGEYNLQEPVYTPMGQSIRRYMSGGIVINKARPIIITAGEEKYILGRNYLISSDMSVVSSSISIAEKLVKGIVNKYRQGLGSYPIKVHCLNVKDELILALILALNNPELKSFSNQENFFIMMFELIENAIKHGEGYPVEIYFRAKENNLIIEVKDYGKGIDFEKLAELLRGAAMNGFIQEHGYMKGVPTVMPPGRNGFIMTKIMLPEEVEAFIKNSKSEIPFVSGLSIDEGRMIIGGVGLYAARRYAKDLGGDLTYETGQGGTTFTIRLPIAFLSSASSAVGAGLPLRNSAGENLKSVVERLQKEKKLPGEIKIIDPKDGSVITDNFWAFVNTLLDKQKWVFSSEDEKSKSEKVSELTNDDLGKAFKEMILSADIPKKYSMLDFLDEMSENINDFFHHTKNLYLKEVMARSFGGRYLPQAVLQKIILREILYRWNLSVSSAVKNNREMAEKYTIKFLKEFGCSDNLFGGIKKLNNPNAAADVDYGNTEKECRIYFNEDWIDTLTVDLIERIAAHEAQHIKTFGLIKRGLKLEELNSIEKFKDLRARMDDYYDKISKTEKALPHIKEEYLAPAELLSRLRGYWVYLKQIERGDKVTIRPREFIEVFRESDLWFLNEKNLFSVASSAMNGQTGFKINPSSADNKGGIDFNALPIQTESVASSALGALFGARAFKGNLDKEWGKIQSVFNAGVRPSIQRLSEYTVAASASPLAEDKIDQVRVMLADILRRDEESQKLSPVEESCKQLLRALEAG